MGTDIERRRTVRIRRSALTRSHLNGLDRPAIKIAETQDEYKQAFALLYREYLAAGYVSKNPKREMVYSPFNFLPDTVIFVAKSYTNVISTLTQVFDSELFGLPMDEIYADELADLRKRGRRLSEIGALATMKDFRWQNLFMFICQIMYWYSHYQKVDDLLITVNPKHVPFYKAIFLFEEFGPEKIYPKVEAPAVLLRMNMWEIEGRVRRSYEQLDFDCNLYDYFHRMNGHELKDFSEALELKGAMPAHRRMGFDAGMARYFLDLHPDIVQELSSAQRAYLKKVYPGVAL